MATGVVAVADSWACTNPSLGAGHTMGLMHVPGPARHAARRVGVDDPAAFGARLGRGHRLPSVEPWYRATLAFDRHRLAEIDAEIRGEAYRPESADWDIIQGLQFAVRSGPRLLPGRSVASSGVLRDRPRRSIADPASSTRCSTSGGGWRDAPLRSGRAAASCLSIVAA